MSRLFFKDDLVLLIFFKSVFQHALNGFAAACDIAGMKIASKMRHSIFRKTLFNVFCKLAGVSLKLMEQFKYLGVAFTSDGRQDEELNVRSDKASDVIRALHHSVVLKRELSRKKTVSV